MRAWFRELPVNQPADVSVIRHVAGQMAAEQNFPGQRLAEIRLMASELAQNHLDHKTKDGRIRVSSLMIQDVPCLTLASIDHGPGIPDVAALLARETGCRSATGLGVGLVSVRRLADQFALCSGIDGRYGCPGLMTAEQGTIIVARSWPDCCPPQVLSDPQFDFAGIVCGRSENMPCGDGLFVSGDDRFLRIVLVDSPGVGKGCAITREVKRRLQDMNIIWPPDQLFERLSFALSAGASMEILRFDRLLQEMQWAGVGNVSTWIVVDGSIVQAAERRPMASSGHGRVRLFSSSVQQQLGCLMHSDGLRSFGQSDIETLLAGKRTNESSLVLQTAFSINRQRQDDAAICVLQWLK
jgi:anti-sigma regulatory factor (Ser/Thr protein kinase)